MLAEEGKYELAMSAFEMIPEDFEETKALKVYYEARQLEDGEKWSDAAALYITIPTTLDSADRYDAINKKIEEAIGEVGKQLAAAKVGDTVTLGSYEQDGDATNGAEAIEWIVLKAEDGEYLLISKYCLEVKAYNEEKTDGTWETCSLRAWLNGEFYETAFTENEKKLIALTDVKNDDNPTWGTEGGNDTQDYVYLLSRDEVNRYFANDDARVCYPTSHAVESGAWTNSDTGAGAWWLRSPGSSSINAADVFDIGDVYDYGDYVDNTNLCARPVVAVRLSNF